MAMRESAQWWEWSNITPIFQKGKDDWGNYRLASFTAIPGKVMDELILETIVKYFKDSEIASSWLVWLKEGEVMFDSLLDSHGEVIDLAEERRAVDIAFLDSSEAFDTVSHDILAETLLMCGLDKQTVRWIEKWPKCCVQSVVISGMM